MPSFLHSKIPRSRPTFPVCYLTWRTLSVFKHQLVPGHSCFRSTPPPSPDCYNCPVKLSVPQEFPPPAAFVAPPSLHVSLPTAATRATHWISCCVQWPMGNIQTIHKLGKLENRHFPVTGKMWLSTIENSSMLWRKVSNVFKCEDSGEPPLVFWIQMKFRINIWPCHELLFFRLQYNVEMELPQLASAHTIMIRKRTVSTTEYSTHPRHLLFEPLSSGKVQDEQTKKQLLSLHGGLHRPFPP